METPPPRSSLPTRQLSSWHQVLVQSWGANIGGEWWGIPPEPSKSPGGWDGHSNPYQPFYMQQVLRGHWDHLCPLIRGLQHTGGLGRERGCSTRGHTDPPRAP